MGYDGPDECSFVNSLNSQGDYKDVFSRILKSLIPRKAVLFLTRKLNTVIQVKPSPDRKMIKFW